jgi:mediator of RNA polymerase II transcription subunit 12, fungi type
MLQRASDSELMAAVIETFHRYITIWTCMCSAATITAALYTAHQVARTRGIQSRILLALLVEIDNGQHLDEPSRRHTSADIAAFTHVTIPRPHLTFKFSLINLSGSSS